MPPALHWATITLSTVGWGDLDVDTRVTRVLGIVLFPPGVAIFAYGLGKIAGVLLDDGEDEDGHDGLGVERITLHQALGMDRDGNKAVDKFEFATGCLLASGRLSEEDLASIMNRFRQLDRDGSGLLTVDDVVPTSLMPGGGELAGGTARGAAEVGAAQRTVVEQAAAGSLESGTIDQQLQDHSCRTLSFDPGASAEAAKANGNGDVKKNEETERLTE
eukprot:g12824.t1